MFKELDILGWCGLYEKEKQLILKERLIHFRNRFQNGFQNGLNNVCPTAGDLWIWRLKRSFHGLSYWGEREGGDTFGHQNRRKTSTVASLTQLWRWGFGRQRENFSQIRDMSTWTSAGCLDSEERWVLEELPEQMQKFSIIQLRSNKETNTQIF